MMLAHQTQKELPAFVKYQNIVKIMGKEFKTLFLKLMLITELSWKSNINYLHLLTKKKIACVFIISAITGRKEWNILALKKHTIQKVY